MMWFLISSGLFRAACPGKSWPNNEQTANQLPMARPVFNLCNCKHRKPTLPHYHSRRVLANVLLPPGAETVAALQQVNDVRPRERFGQVVHGL